ncbi:Acetyltransferase [Bifidobacterium sp. DSM 109960]|uniref:Acetyltransferase n=1 Tax=Bifidobacterium erythrocebi TaxID=2675325 RepID=A0A7Y0EUN5_9BIFI|nr:glutathione S-transferase family protein [Bifidobacterium sp. DSM 109960]NMM95666.1 Acetyltransferase [Bifidobacterium sp. DSM 109960]
MGEHRGALQLDGSDKARILPNGAVDSLGFFVSSTPTVTEKGVYSPDGNLKLQYSPLDPRAWSSLLAYRIAHFQGIEPHIDHLSDSTWHGVAKILPDVRLSNGEDRLLDDDWHGLSRLIEQWSGSDAVLYPDRLRDRIDALDDIIDRDLVYGLFSIVYAAAQNARSPQELSKRDFLHGAQTHAALRRVFYARLGWLDDVLSRSPYLLGDALTDADLHLFGVLLTFDIGYRSAFPAPDAAIVDYPHLWAFAKRIYRTEGLVSEEEKRAIGLIAKADGTYEQPWGAPAFTETVDSIAGAWNQGD